MVIIVLLIMIAISISEFVITLGELSEIKHSVALIKYAFRRNTDIQ
jgi:hypothetical protein